MGMDPAQQQCMAQDEGLCDGGGSVAEAGADAMTAARFLIGWTKAVDLVLVALAAEAAIGAAISEYIH
jgi:hypothetical protein